MATYRDHMHDDGTSTKQYEVNSVSIGQETMPSAASIANGVETMVAPDTSPLVDPMENASTGYSVKLWIRTICPCNCGGSSRFRAYVSLAILATVNLLNYMDRYTLAGVLSDVQHFYGIDNSQSGFLQSAFIISYMVFSMLFGYLGDRFNRKVIMTCGIFLWSAITLGSSFVGQQYFWAFLITRALVGIGEASYSTIAPTVLADLFVGDSRTLAFAIFYFAIPVGSGLGYIVGSEVAQALHLWQWALRITPCFGFVCSILILTVVYDPPRGASEGSTHLATTSWFSDIKYLTCNKSFVLSTLGFTCVAFVTGALAFWAPSFMTKAAISQNLDMSSADMSMIFGIITCVAGLAGVTIGTRIASKLRPRCKDADPLVCAVGLTAGTPFLFIALVISRLNINVTWVCIFVSETLLFFNWALITDILMYVIIPTRRSTAEAVQILVSHALGDASSPYLIGLISDTLRDKGKHSDFASLQYSLYMTCFVCAIGGAFFFATTLYVHEDRLAAERAVSLNVNAQNNSSETDDSENSDNQGVVNSGAVAV